MATCTHLASPPPSELKCPIANRKVRKIGDPCPLCRAEVMHALLNRKEKCRITELKVGRVWARVALTEVRTGSRRTVTAPNYIRLVTTNANC